MRDDDLKRMYRRLAALRAEAGPAPRAERIAATAQAREVDSALLDSLGDRPEDMLAWRVAAALRDDARILAEAARRRAHRPLVARLAGWFGSTPRFAAAVATVAGLALLAFALGRGPATPEWTPPPAADALLAGDFEAPRAPSNAASAPTADAVFVDDFGS